MGVKIRVSNSRAVVSGLSPKLFALLRFELSHEIGQPGIRTSVQRKTGDVVARYWDGWTSLLLPSGVMPAGLLPRAYRLLAKWGTPPVIEDVRQRPDSDPMPLWSLPKGFVLRDYQMRAVEAALVTGRGVIDSPPRSGKTIIQAELLRRIVCRSIITAPTEAIASQTYDKLRELLLCWSGLGPSYDDFYLLAGGAPTSQKARAALQRAMIVVATDASAVCMPPSFWDSIQCWISDERHHQASTTHRQINDLASNAFYRFGFTGTNYRSDTGEHVALEAPLGRTLISYSIADMVGRGVIVPARVEFWPIYRPGLMGATFKTAYADGIVTDELRNNAVVLAARLLRDQGRKVLVLVQQIRHGEILQSRIHGSEFVKGEDGAEVRAAVKRLDQGKIRVLIGSPVVGEGLDCPSADALVYAKGRRARVTHTQDTFRVLTADGIKRDAIIIDFADRHNTTLLDHTCDRARNYQLMGIHCTVLDRVPVDTSDQLL